MLFLVGGCGDGGYRVLMRGLVLALGLTGCSFIIVRVPDAPPRDCSLDVPVIDTALAAGLVAAGVIAESDASTGRSVVLAGAGLEALVAAGAYAASAIYGYVQKGRCRDRQHSS